MAQRRCFGPVHRWTLPALAVGVAVALSACERAAAADKAEENASKPNRIVVCGIDRSESYDALLAEGRRLCAKVIREARPGDEIVLRWVSSTSFSSRDATDGIPNFIRRITIPQSRDCSANPFDTSCRRQGLAVVRAKHEAEEHIRQLKARGAEYTDLYGFFQAASEVLRHADPERERWVYLASDMIDTRGFNAVPDLSGTRVVIFGFETSPDPMITIELRRSWEEYFKKHGAVDVSFFQAEVVQ